MEENKFNLDDCEITIRLNPKGAMKAQAQIDYGSLRIYGYRVMINKEDKKPYVLPPSIQSGTGYKAVIRLSPREQWDKLCERILEQYEKEISKLNSQDSDDEIDPDDLPF